METRLDQLRHQIEQTQAGIDAKLTHLEQRACGPQEYSEHITPGVRGTDF
jgi:hypothetical protein